ncbi:DegT/DnrJ/EryC1/StrS family aminotransferase [Desulfurispirillum indicum]|uniref:DegT/DnrJ/EryC1/StrS aminotransferase n=1 Tax=Desulfurispirillum indicum (strain ATCC BAA-1389 / DSM 22839 / S5) TaxID=653733 RepID=E6W1S7_DESIS|nr:DegT/DnrJ/EryC1/StrS family aminotransferase [Desulfurispirillum indicum]ADU65459.1 DegT/DnrJ/EryC1/StrS aminotransferase [Desulfurispirillum indicum S5]UCZ57379.1 DegT/DnrJ/EryC1/StrS family aminotransferase [Desulfurispirillum indicum]
MQIEFINVKAQYQAYQQEIDAAMAAVTSSGQFIFGPVISQLEKDMATYTGARHCATCASGTDAILLALMAIGVGPGDEVITTPFTFVATVETVAFLGARPVFVDIDSVTYNIDPAAIEAKITPRTKAILPVSLYGQPADMDEINAIAEKHGLQVIEDAAQSFGASYKGKKSGHLSHIGVTSFFPSKPLGCFGDGGALFCDDDELQEKLLSLRNHGQGERYAYKYIGINSRLDALQAAVLSVKLRYLDQEMQRRETLRQRYDNGLSGLNDIVVPRVKADRTTACAQYSIRCDNRQKLIDHLTSRKIPTAVHYPIPLHLQEAYAYLGYRQGDFPVSEATGQQIMSLPFSAFLQEDEQDVIIEAVKTYAKQ